MIYDSKVQEKLYQIITTKMDIPCYDYIPTNSKMPYIKIDSCYYIDNSAKDINSISLVQYVQVFSDYKGKKEIRDIVAEMNDKVLDDWNDEDMQILPEIELVRMSEHKNKDGSFYNQATVMYKFTIFEK